MVRDDETEVAGPTTTETLPDRTSPTTTTATTAPGAPSLTFAGTYEGVGHDDTTSPVCPDITQDLDLTLAVDDGSTWSLHADYCATPMRPGSGRARGPSPS